MRHDQREAIISGREHPIPCGAARGRGFSPRRGRRVRARRLKFLVLTRFLHANRSPPTDQVRGHASLENAIINGFGRRHADGAWGDGGV
jgi:hypothetical protein